jgi:glucose/arabinose dehydrogenase
MVLGIAACGSPNGASSPDAATPAMDAGPTVDLAMGPGPKCTGAIATHATPGLAPAPVPGLVAPAGFTLERIAQVPGARELVALPNGDLLVATTSSSIYLVPNAESSGATGAPVEFANTGNAPSQGIAFDPPSCTLFVGGTTGIFEVPYQDGITQSTVHKIASVRSGPIAPNSDGDVHVTTSVAVGGGRVYAGVGSSCNACVEVDPTRATIQQMGPDGSNMSTRATRFRNAIALAINPQTGTLWAGGAGQDNLPLGHPYEFFDAVTLHPGVADYGWPVCEEDHNAFGSGADCSSTVAPLVELPAYSTIIGAAFYPTSPAGAHAFPQRYRGGVFLTGHGSWHQVNGRYYSPPRVVFVPMNGDMPATPVNWSDPTVQWSEFIGGFLLADGITRIGRPTGIAVGAQGSLFIADDQNNVVYRVRPM